MGKLGRPLSFSKSCNIYMYILGVSFFRASPIVFQLKPSKPFLNVTSNHETIHDKLQHGSHVFITISKIQDTDLHRNLPGTFHYTYFQHNMYPLLIWEPDSRKMCFFRHVFFQPNSSTQPDSDSWLTTRIPGSEKKTRPFLGKVKNMKEKLSKVSSKKHILKATPTNVHTSV